MANRVLAGRYELIEKIGEGGMAVVFRARDVLLSRSVAIKILRPEYTKDMMFVSSFRRESQLAASIVDPNIVNVYDVGKEGNIYYIVMELVEGETLSDIIKREAPLDPRRAAQITRQIAMALSTAHKHNLIHRDVKPHNVLISAGDVAKISDFGIAKVQSAEDADPNKKDETVMGSIHYFSPEQARGAYVDERSDIYSLGIVLYEMLTGKVPFDAPTAVEVAIKHMNEPMVPPSKLNPNIPQDLEHIVMKATAKLQTERYNNVDEMITELSFVKYSRQAERNPGADTQAKDETPEQRRARIREEKKQEKSRRARKTALFAVAAVGLLVAAFLIGGLVKLIGGSGARTIKAPNIVSMNVEQASAYLKQFDLKLDIDMQIVSSEPSGTVLSQDPKSDSKIKTGQTIKVSISRGSSETSVPVITGKTQSNAENVLKNYGYKVGEITGEYSETVPKGLVISQNPLGGAELVKNGTVNFVVSLGSKASSGIEMTSVPNLVHKTLAEAQKLIESAGLVLESATEQPSTSVASGKVISQTLQAGSDVEKGSAISIIVSTGLPEPRDVTITLDYSLATEETFRVTVTLQDGENGTSNVFVEQRSKSSPAEKVVLSGKGESSAVKVFFTYESGKIDTVYDYSINFLTGTVK